MKRLRDEERWAQVCIEGTLPDCTVEPHDSMYGLKIVYADWSIGAVETTTAAHSEGVAFVAGGSESHNRLCVERVRSVPIE